MRLNPASIKQGESAFDTFPVFKNYKDIKGPIGNIEADTILTYVLWAYAKESELVRTYQDARKLKEAAAEKVGWKKTKGKYGDTVERILNNEEEKVRRTIAKVFLIQNDLEYTAYRAELETYGQMINEMISPLTTSANDDEKLKAINLKATTAENKERMLERLIKRRFTLFNQDEELENAVKENDLEDSGFGEGIAEKMARKLTPQK